VQTCPYPGRLRPFCDYALFSASLSICDGLEAYPPLEQVFFQIAFIDIQSFYEV